MKLTRHNGRSGKHGVYNPKHNDRSFDVNKADHIDSESAGHDALWDCYQGYATQQMREDEELSIRFEEIESLYYWEHYDDYCQAQH